MSKVTAIILNYNSLADSEKCALYLKKQSIETDIVIIDNNSKDDLEKLSAFCNENEITFISNKENRGYSAGNNIGLRFAVETGSQYSMIINPDVEIRDKDYIEKAIEVLDNDKSIAVLGSKIQHLEGFNQNPMREMTYSEELLFPLETLKAKLKKESLYIVKNKKNEYCEKLSGCCFFIRNSFAKQIGFLDENVFLYCEEPILAQTVKREGMHEFYFDDITAYHMHVKSEKGNLNKRLQELFKSRRYYLEAYSGYGKFKLKLLLASKKLQFAILMRKNKK